MITRTNNELYYSVDNKYTKFGFIKNGRFYINIDFYLFRSGFSIKDFEEIIQTMKNSDPLAENIN